MYEDCYKLKTKPFRLTPDPRFFFGSRGHKQALAYLRYGIKQSEGLVIVTGDVGTGKSLLVSTLVKLLPERMVIGAPFVSRQMRADDMLRMVADAFGVSCQDTSNAALLGGLEAFFRDRAQEGKRTLLLIDECQALSHDALEELRMLSNLELNGRPLLQGFLFGQREFREIMRSEGFEQLRQRVVAAYHLKPLDANETRGYIEYRLRRAGWKGDPSFSDDVFAAIHTYTEGVPRRINTLMDRLLLYGYLQKIHQIKRDVLDSVVNEIINEQGEPTNPIPSERLSLESLPKSGSQAFRDLLSESAKLPSSQVSNDADTRLAAVEQSMEDLTRAVREQLALLREALLRQRDTDEV